MNSALRQFSNDDIVCLLECNGLETKVERGNRVFPVSDKAKDVVDTLVKIYTDYGGKLITDCKVTEITVKDGVATGVKTTNGHFTADKVILCAGGASYPVRVVMRRCEACGEGGAYHCSLKTFSRTLVSDYAYIDDLQGLSLRNVSSSAGDGKSTDDFGEMLFTHFGVSGPIIFL